MTFVDNIARAVLLFINNVLNVGVFAYYLWLIKELNDENTLMKAY